MSAKKWKFYYRETEYPFLSESVINTIILWTSIGLFWMSYWSAIKEYFSSFVEVSYTSIIVIVMWLFLLWLFYEVILPRLKGRKKVWAYLVPIGNFAILIGYFIMNLNAIFTGLLAVLNRYLKYYNIYYSTNISIGGGEAANAGIGFVFLSCVLWALLWTVAYGLKRRWILGLFPLIAIGIDLSVGFSPTGNSMKFYFFGMMLMIALGSKEKVTGEVYIGTAAREVLLRQKMLLKVIVIVAVIASLLLTNLLYKDNFETLATKKQELLDYQETLIEQIATKKLFSSIDIQFNKEVLDNSKPIYTGAKVLSVTTTQKPNGSMYLKGYHGTTYEDGVWTTENEYYSSACSVKGVKEEYAAKELFHSAYNQLPAYIPIVPDVMEFSIKYLAAAGNVAYVPYMTSYDSLNKEYSLAGDYTVEKSIMDKEIKGVALNLNGASAGCAYYIGGITQGSGLEGIFEWYDYAARDGNTYVPENIKYALKEIPDVQYWTMAYASVWSKVAAVQEYLRVETSYSMDLENLPEGADPVIYFLEESKEGYCMHYATAGAMMLRYMGHPARYVSGYVVPENAFELNENGIYTATVKDYNAHAWVEVYIDGLGWMPVEMTPGYENGSQTLPTNPYEPIQNEQNPTQEESESEFESESESESESERESESESEKVPQEVLPTEKENEKDSQDGLGQNANHQATENGLGKIIKFLVIGGSIAAIVFIGIQSVRLWMKRYHSVLEKAIRRKYTRRAVKRMHRRVYKYLRIRKSVLKDLRDKEIEGLLIDTFVEITSEDWQHYMEIVKKMHYSEEDISEEEMMHCYECYKVVLRSFQKKE